MKLRFSNGNQMPVLGLGTWQSKPEEVESAVLCAVRNGYLLIDTASAYMNEQEIGRALKKLFDEGTVKRDELFITTKLWMTFLRPDLVEGACRNSLKKLSLDYMDLYLIHAPVALKEEASEILPKDEEGNVIFSDVDYVDTFAAMQPLVEKGLVRNLGVSNFNISQMRRLLSNDWTYPPVCLQVEISPHFRNEKLVQFCHDNKIAVTAYSTLGCARHPYAPKDRRLVLEEDVVKDIAAKLHKSVAQVVLRWAIQRGLAVIPKSVTESRIIENAQVFDFELSNEEMKTISSIDYQYRVCSVPFLKDHKNFPHGDD